MLGVNLSTDCGPFPYISLSIALCKDKERARLATIAEKVIGKRAGSGSSAGLMALGRDCDKHGIAPLSA